MDLSIERIYGTSSNNQVNVSVSTNLIAYVASGGVVVSRIDRENGRLTDQRFLCAYNNTKQVSSAYTQYNYQSQYPDGDKDQYGTPKPSHTILLGDLPQIGDLSLNSPAAKQSSQSQKIKTISCVAISPDERFLAVGETGIQPRILIFSLAPDSNDFPISSVVEHNFGVFALKFSPNSKYLVSIGETHDGFIYLWRINGLGLEVVGANKCTSQINGIFWDEDIIITFGLRHIKLWKFEEFEKKSMIQGKNAILGDYINSNFVYCSKGFDEENNFLFLNSIGEIYTFNLDTNTLKLRYIYDNEKIGSFLINENHLWIGGDTIQTIPIEKLRDVIHKDFDGNLDSPTKVKFTPRVTLLEKISEKYLFYVTSAEEIFLYDIETELPTSLIDSLSKSVYGLKITSNSKIINWTKDGILKIIDQKSSDMTDFIQIKLPEIANKVIENHITSLEITKNDEIIVGDSYGNLTIYDASGIQTFSIAAHEFSINDISYVQLNDIELLFSIGRDRMIQVFAKSQRKDVNQISSSWSLLQTLDEHKGNLLKLLIQDDKVYVASADRTISVHKISIKDHEVSIFKEKMISLKSSPSAIVLSDNDLLVSTMDKNITIFNTRNLEQTRSFKLYDDENETLLIDSAAFTSQNQLICSCSDKSLRVFTYTSGKQIAVNWGHSDPVKFLILSSLNQIITLSKSGCLFSWNLKTEAEAHKSTIQRYSDLNTPPKIVRKIKKAPGALQIKRPLTSSPSSTRTPTVPRLSSTPRLTPSNSRLTTTSKTTLSPSSNSSPSSSRTLKVSPKQITPTPAQKSSFGGILSTTQVSMKPNNENMPKVSEILHNLRLFKKNIDSYSYEDVRNVKKELKDIFKYEDELLESYNTIILNSIRNLK